MRALVNWLIIAIAVAFGVGSLVLFAAARAIPGFRLSVSTAYPLWWDTALSLFFFAQHSGMVRRGFQRRLSAILPKQYQGAAFAIASGIVLTAVVLLWQPTHRPLLVLTGPALWATYLLAVAMLALFAWAAAAASSLDFFGVGSIRRSMTGRREQPPRFVARGPYTFLRHPFYACVIVLLWCAPVLTADRLLLDVLWTAWILGATFLEERDLISDFGDRYRDYRRRVPMLIPWKGSLPLDEG